MRSFFKKCISFLLVALMIVQCSSFFMPRASAAAFATAQGTVLLGNVKLGHTQTLTDLQDGTYELRIELRDATSLSDANEDSGVSRNGYFTAPATGDYLVEIWGGDGAPGSSAGGGDPGQGGKGGYIYGVVTLKKGETLFYQLGGNGQQTITEDEGGGANGSGGGGGSITTYTVGGGGGYSAVYKFAAGEFEGKYLDAEGNMIAENITEGDRTTKYIIIAGGGGGGGASSGGLFGLGFFGDAGNPPSGGNGGSITSDTRALGSGTVYVGSDGLTSGSDPDYVGRGGTNEPGQVSKMWLTQGWFSGSSAKDWFATENGGGGGSGNGRGGSGGAGYCGGSGGVQSEIVLSTNVGGGGGGSSFVASEVSAPTEEQKTKLQNSHNSSTGGAIYITPLSASASAELADGVDLTFTPSSYFTITSISGEDVQSQGGNTWRVPVSTDPTVITIVFAPIDGFAGGNNVPLLTGSSIACNSVSMAESCTIPLFASCSAVNVPLNFRARGNSWSFNAESAQFSPSELYKDYYEEVRNSLPSPQYDFIDSVGSYIVCEEGSDEPIAGEFTVRDTKVYTVSFTVTPTTRAAAAVGDPVTKTVFSDVAKITKKKPGEGELNGNTVTYDKNLVYENGEYILSITADISAPPVDVPTVEDANADLLNAFTESTQYTIKYSGYYYIQTWGGDGGNGGSSRADNTKHTGGAGGSGAYLGSYIYLNKGDILTIDPGTAGALGTTKEADISWTNWTPTAGGTKGGAGGATTVKLTRNGVGSGIGLISTAGGGGGGGSYSSSVVYGVFGTSGHDGLAGLAGSTSPLAASFNGVTAASPGQDGSSAEPLSGAAGGTSYLDSTYLGQQKAGFALTTSTSGFKDSDYTGAGGAAKITCLQIDDTEYNPEAAANISAYYLNTRITKYFDIESIVGIDTNNTENGVLAMTVPATPYNNDLVQITGINPVNKKTTDPETGNVVVSASFTIEFHLTPKDGFLGGNDVPVLIKDDKNANAPIGMRLLQKNKDDDPEWLEIDVEYQAVTDYANVELNYVSLGVISPGVEFDGTANDRTINQATDETSIPISNLYTWTYKPNLSQYEWEADYVKLVERVTDPGGNLMETDLAPEVTTPYTVIVGLAPKYTGEKATVVSPVLERTVATSIEVIVLPRIHYLLSNMTASDALDSGSGYENGYTSIEPGEDHAITLSAVSGYVLPDAITVRDTNGADITAEVGYDSDTGKLTIPAEYAFGTITVEGVALPKTYSITYYYQETPGGAFVQQPGGAYVAGAALSLTPPTQPAVEGYQFKWDWGDGVAEAPTIMPGRNLIVIGAYTANQYDLTIHYVYENGDPAAETYTSKVGYSADYQVTSPVIEGYLPDKVTVSGTMPASNLEVTVTYKPTANQLNIFYFYKNSARYEDGTQVTVGGNPIDVQTTYPTNDPYSATSPTVPGYSPDKAVVEGIMGTKGVTEYVYYSPNSYTVTFHLNYDDLVYGTRQVQYDNLYSYDVNSKTYTNLPTPYRTGYDFLGWTTQLEKTSGGEWVDADFVNASDLMNVAGDHVLYAQWKAKQYTVTIRYIDDATGSLLYFGGSPENPLKVTGDYGATYTIYSPAYQDYTVDKAVVTGIFTEDVVIPVVYTAPKTYTLTIYYLNSEDESQVHAPVVVENLKEGYEYSIASPEIDGYTCSRSTVTGVIGTSNKVEKVYYTLKPAETIVSVTIEWGDLIFTYEQGAWQPEDHTYERDEIAPSANLSNQISVTNGAESTIPVNISIQYQYYLEGEGVTGYFTVSDTPNSARISNWTLLKGTSQTVYLWLEGSLTNKPGSNTITSGQCIITITGGS